MHRGLNYILFLFPAILSFSQIKQGKSYFDGDSTKIREIFSYSIQDSVLQGSYESFYLNGSLQAFGWFSRNLPDSSWLYYYENGRPKAEGKYRNGNPNGKWKYYFENGNIKSEGILRGLSKDGYWAFYYENGGEKSNGIYFDNRKSGIWNYFYEDGSLKAQSYMEDGKGRYTEFYPSGSRRMEGFNREDKSEGEWIYYFETGEVEAIGSFENGLKTGDWIYYYKNGMIAAEGAYLKGLKSGEWIYYHENGNISQKGKVTDDQKDGYWKLFYPSGELQGEASLQEGTGNYNEYYPSGTRKSQGQLVNGKKDGKWYYYGENGELEGKADFEAGEGEYIGYYPDGTIKMNGRLKEDKRIGEWTLYDPDGSTAGTYHPIYEDEKPIFKSRVSEDPTERRTYDKPEYKFKRKGFKYFEPTINEYRGIILGTNPAWLVADRLPIALEYYMQERLGYELQVDIISDPFFRADENVPVYDIYRRGSKIHFRQKFYSLDRAFGMTYFGHQLSFRYLNHQVNHLDSAIVNATVFRYGNLTASGFGYGIFAGSRWMKNAGNSGLTMDVFLGVSIEGRSFKKQYENESDRVIQILDNYFQREIGSSVHFPVIFGVNIGFVGPKSKSKTQ
ncbi:MAG: toxin-antitoxin system YwqK family antitoxin [Ekhidna sp.]|nr:toxin-antitoxin system YwqK family antitoxin [Ekhidna sp.]